MSFNFAFTNGVQNYNTQIAKKNQNKLNSIISPSPQILSVVTIDYNETQTIHINCLIATPTLNIINVPLIGPSIISLPSDNQIQGLFENPLVGSILQFTVETNGGNLTIQSENSSIVLNSQLSNVYLQVSGVQPFTISLKQISGTGSTGSTGATGSTGPQGIGITSFGSTAPFFSNVAGGTGALGVLNGVALNTVANTALGAGAMRNLTDNSNNNNNVAIGYNSMLGSGSSISSNRNSALGAYSLYSNTTGYSNTAIGYQSLYSITTATGTTSVGSNSLYSNTIGYQNTAVGSNALYANTTGYQNIAIGTLALANNTTGSGNTAIGPLCMQSTTTGAGNVVIGYQSLNTSTLGNNNTVIGYQSMTSVTTGSSNVGVGYNSGLNVTTGNYNIYIGNSSTASTSAATNEVVIGSSAAGIVGKGNNTAFIYAPAGLYSYMPAYGHFRSTSINLGLMLWNTTLFNQNISVSNQTVTFALDGLYEIIFSGTVQSISLGGSPSGQLYINGSLYSPGVNAFSYGAHTGPNTRQALSFTIMYRMTAGSTMYMLCTNVQGNGSNPSYLTIKYIGL